MNYQKNHSDNWHGENPLKSSDWIDRLLSDASLWKASYFSDFPAPISLEYRHMQEIFAKKQVFAMVYQLKDLGEVLLKFPVLCGAAILLDDNITKLLVEKPLSLGDWERIGMQLVKKSHHAYVYDLPQPLRVILEDVLNMYSTTRFVSLRNQYIGHGAMGFDENEEYHAYCEKLLRAIAAHLEYTQDAYGRLKLVQGLERSVTLLVDGKETELSPFFVQMGDGLYFFDYLDGRKRVPPSYGLDYVAGGSHKCFDAPYFANVYARTGCTYDGSFVVEGAVSDTDAEKELASVNAAANFVKPDALIEWVKENVVDESRGGVHLLTMQRGMGKTSFAYALEKGIVRLNGVKVCAYYCSHTQMRGLGSFIQGIMNVLTGTLVETTINALPKLEPLAENKAENMVKVLSGFRDVYASRGEGAKLLLIIDGLDEIPAECAGVFEYVPASEDMPEDVYILLTARNPEKELLALHTQQGIGGLSIGEHYVVNPESAGNIATLKKYLTTTNIVKTETGFRKITVPEVERLLELSGNTFINLCIYTKLVESGYAIDELPEQNSEQVFAYYLSELRTAYGEKLYKEALRLLLLIATAQEDLTLQELAYLCGYPGVTLRMLAFMKDFGAIVKTIRSGARGTLVAIGSERYKEYIEQTFSDELQDLMTDLLAMLQAEDPENYVSDTGTENIPDGVLYLAANVVTYLGKYTVGLLQKQLEDDSLWRKFEEFGTSVQGTKLYRLWRTLGCYDSALYYFSSSEQEEFLARLLINRAHVNKQLTRYEEALVNAEHAVDILERLLQQDILTDGIYIAFAYMKRAGVYSCLQRYDESIVDYDRAVEILEKKFPHRGPKDILCIARAHMGRARVYQRFMRYEEALIDLELAIMIFKRLYDQRQVVDASDFADAWESRADIYVDLSCYEEALKDLDVVVEIRESLFQQGDLEEENGIALAYMNRANLLRRMGDSAAAKVDLDKALEITERLWRQQKLADERELAVVYINRSNIYSDLSFHSEALECAEHAIEIFERLFRQGKPIDENNVAKSYMNRASVYSELTRYEEALSDLDNAIEIMEQLFKQGRLLNANDLAGAYINRAVAFQNVACHLEALADVDRATEIRKQLIKQGTRLDCDQLPRLLRTRADTYLGLTRYEEAIAVYEQALEVMESLLEQGEQRDEVSLANVYLNRAVANSWMNRREEALADYERAIDIFEWLFEQGNSVAESKIAQAREGRASIYAHLGYLELGLMEYRTVLQIQNRLLQQGKTRDVGRIAIIYANMAQVYRQLTCYDTALSLYDRAIEIQEKLYAQGQLFEEVEMLWVLLNKGDCLSKAGDPKGAVDTYGKGILFAESLPPHRHGYVREQLAELHLHRAIVYQKELCDDAHAAYDFEWYTRLTST